MSRAANRDGLRVSLAAWAQARLYVAAAYIVTAAVTNRFEPPPAFTPGSDGLLAWDGRWYELIAAHGYGDSAGAALRFFPLWPLLGRALGYLPALGPGLGLVIAGNVLAVAVGVLLHRVVLDETADAGLARRAVRLMALAPPSFVLVLAYSEALFLTLALAAFAAARSKRWWIAAACGFLAGLTRPVGALLTLPLALAAWRDRSPGHAYDSADGDCADGAEPSRRSLAGIPVAAATAAVAPLAGAASFVVWVAARYGDAALPFDTQRELRGDLAEPVSRLVRAAWRGFGGDSGELLHFLAGLGIVCLAVVAARRLSAPLSVYAAASVVMLLAADNLNSLERYALAAFPLVIAAAVLSRSRLLDGWIVGACGAGMVCLATLAFAGVYVP